MEAAVAIAPAAAPAAGLAAAVDPFAGMALPALTPLLNLAGAIFLIGFILRKGTELAFGK